MSGLIMKFAKQELPSNFSKNARLQDLTPPFPIPVYGDGSNIRDWLYVEDHCSGIDVVIRKGRSGEVYNIGGINEWNNINIVRSICILMDEENKNNAPHDSLISYVTDRPGHDWRYAIDAGKMGSELNWKPVETFETGISKTVEWYLGS